jgi:starch synthase
MNVLITSAEAVPFAKVGGLADVVGSLPAALRREGVDARVVMPGYGQINHQRYNINFQFSFQFYHNRGISDVNVYMCVYDGVPFYFIQGYPYIGGENSVYSDWEWDSQRFIWFNQAVMATIHELRTRENWVVDVLNVNDWHTALLPFLVAINRYKEEWSKLATVITIHNIAYMGNYVQKFLYDAGIPYRAHWLVDRYGLHDNLLGIGLSFADKINTVSPRYATEIQYPWAGYELAGLMYDRRADLVGILNGIDDKLWDPATDRYLVQNFDASNFEVHRPANKLALQQSAHLPQRADIPIIGLVSRLTAQKGFDFAMPALWRFLAEEEVQFVLLGTGEDQIEHQVRLLAGEYPWKVRAYLEYDAALAQQIYAGCDIFLMPSHFEPCGIGQMLAMRYGALPLVRETGGLADTVQNYDGGNADYGTGFVFSWETSNAVLGTMRWATRTFRENQAAWKRMQKRAMETDFSWETSAKQYIDLYSQAKSKFQGD